MGKKRHRTSLKVVKAKKVNGVAMENKDPVAAKPLPNTEEPLRQAFNLILPYLPFVDLVALSASRPLPFISTLVDHHLSSRKETRIDVKFIERFPVEENQTIYQRLAQATKIPLTLSGLAERDTESLLSDYFTRLTSLTLDDIVTGLTCIEELPKGIERLKLVDCFLSKSQLEGWIDRLWIGLKSLHLCRVYWDVYSHYAYFGRLLQSTSIEDFTLEEMDGTFDFYLSELNEDSDLRSFTIIAPSTVSWLQIPEDGHRLERLTIGRGVDPVPPDPYDGSELEWNFQTLRHLSMGCLQPDALWKNFKFNKSFKSFECHFAPISIEKIYSWKHLEDVKIHCNWYHADQLRRHFYSLPSVKNYVVTCCRPTPGYNLIYSLNEDCLRKIASYLSEDDACNLSLAHPRFVSLRSMVHLNPEFMRKYPTRRNASLYKMMGDNAKQLKVVDIGDASFFNVIGQFKCLQRLAMIQPKKMVSELKVPIVPFVTDLHLAFSFNCGSSAFWTAFCRHLNPSLRRLQVDGNFYSLKPMLELTNIEELRIAFVEEANSMRDILKILNQNTKLTRLDIRIRQQQKSVTSLINVLEEVPRDTLQSLVIRDEYGSDQNNLLAHTICRFQNLNSLRITDRALCMHSDLEVLSGLTKLRTLTISGKELDETIASIPRILNKLRTLNVRSYISFPAWLFERELNPLFGRKEERDFEFYLSGKGYTVFFPESK